MINCSCNVCGGRGQQTTEFCPVCAGRKVGTGSNILRVDVEKGMYDGERIVFSREADESPDMVAGDLIVILKELDHDIYNRIGDDLKMKHFLTLKEALLGFKTEIKHLHGTITLERNQITQNGFIMTIKEKGMPKDLFADTYGDLYIEFSIVLPVSLTQAQKNTLEIL